MTGLISYKRNIVKYDNDYGSEAGHNRTPLAYGSRPVLTAGLSDMSSQAVGNPAIISPVGPSNGSGTPLLFDSNAVSRPHD